MFDHVKYQESPECLPSPGDGTPTSVVTNSEEAPEDGWDRSQQIQVALLAIGERLRQHIAEVGHRLDLTPQQALLLDRLGTRQTMGQVASSLKCDPSNVTGLIRRLKLRGLVTREADDVDRRTKWLSLTPAGVAARESLLREMFQGTTVLDGLDEDGQEQFLAHLRVVAGNMDAGADSCLSS